MQRDVDFGRPAPLICASCGRGLEGRYYVLGDRPERYCARCMAERPRCDGCGAPVGEQHWRLHDGRVLCARCHATAVYSPERALALFEQTVGQVEARLRLRLRVGVAFRMVDAPTLARLRASGGADNPDEKILGLYHRDGPLRVIYALYGLPLLTFRTVVAHEYAHAWQGENCPLLEDDALREGFAEWVAYQLLLHLGCTHAARRMLTSSHPYRPFLEQVLDLERRTGPAGVLEHMRASGQGRA